MPTQQPNLGLVFCDYSFAGPLEGNCMAEKIRANIVAQLTAAGEPFELVPGTVFGRECLRFKNAPATLGTLFAEARSDAPFIVYGDERMSFAETYAAAARVATVLVKDYGIERGDRVAISMRNYPEWILSFMAVTSIGGIAVAMNALNSSRGILSS